MGTAPDEPPDLPNLPAAGVGRSQRDEGLYPFRLEDARASISAYLVKLGKALTDAHQLHKYEALRAALMAPVDIQGVAVLDGKTVGLCKYALRNA